MPTLGMLMLALPSLKPHPKDDKCSCKLSTTQFLSFANDSYYEFEVFDPVTAGVMIGARVPARVIARAISH